MRAACILLKNYWAFGDLRHWGARSAPSLGMPPGAHPGSEHGLVCSQPPAHQNIRALSLTVTASKVFHVAWCGAAPYPVHAALHATPAKTRLSRHKRSEKDPSRIHGLQSAHHIETGNMKEHYRIICRLSTIWPCMHHVCQQWPLTASRHMNTHAPIVSV